MIPEIFTIGGLPINSFGLMVALALLAGMHLLAQSFRRHQLDEKKAEAYVFVGGISGLIGARVWHILEHPSDFLRDPMALILSSAGFTFYGGAIIAFGVMYLWCRKDGIPFARFLDASGPTMTLGYAIGRLGCQLSGDGDYGKFTDSIFGMSYVTGVVPTPPGFFAYPTPLYESTICLGILWVLLKVEQDPSWNYPLKRFGLYFSLISIERFFVEFLRINPHVLGVLSQAQVLSIIFVLVGVVLVMRKPQPMNS